jgi:hypothetical protein
MYIKCGTQVVTSEKRRRMKKEKEGKLKRHGDNQRGKKRGNKTPILKFYLTPKIIYEMNIFLKVHCL